MPSEKQLEANRANAQLSTGPTTPEGKAKVSHNALKTGLTGRTILLPTDDVTAYQALVARTFEQFAPETDEEKHLTQSLADTLWRLDRIPALETGIYAIARRELASEFADESDESVRNAMIEAKAFLTYRRELSNLSLQESRLRRNYEKDEALLYQLIAERREREHAIESARRDRRRLAIASYQRAKDRGVPFDPAEFGFEFSAEEIAAYLDEMCRNPAPRNEGKAAA